MRACGLRAPFSSQSVSLAARLSLRVSSYINTSGIFSSLSPLSWEQRGQRGEARAPVKWLYRGETRAGRGPRLKAEWQAAEAIKIEPLSLAARALLIQAGAQATRTHICSHTHTHTHTHPHTLSHTHTHTHTHTHPA